MGSRWRRLTQVIQRDGLRRTARRQLSRLRWRMLEYRMGVHTGGSIDPCLLGHSPSGFGYQPIDYGTFQSALQRVPIDPRQSVFLDYGCGKGRALLLAARLPFRRVLGVEISPELCDQACANVRRARRFLVCPDVQVVRADATEYIPPDDVSVVFLYNPFDEQVVRLVLDRLNESLSRRPRPLHIVYALPNSRPDVLSECPWLTAECLTTDNPSWERLSVYTSRLATGSNVGSGAPLP
jgi:SAM-dependent methyltransferase